MHGVRLGVFKGHEGEVVAVSWTPFSERMLASGGKDRVRCGIQGEERKIRLFSRMKDMSWR